jgi:hypothetical protein
MQVRVLSGAPNMKEGMIMEEFKYYFVEVPGTTEEDVKELYELWSKD